MSQGSTHDIQLTNGAAWWLVNIFNNQAIVTEARVFTKPADVFHVGMVLTGPLEPMQITPEAAFADEKKGSLKKEWMAEEFPMFQITEPQRDAIKRGLEALCNKSILAPHKHILQLLESFGLKPQ